MIPVGARVRYVNDTKILGKNVYDGSTGTVRERYTYRSHKDDSDDGRTYIAIDWDSGITDGGWWDTGPHISGLVVIGSVLTEDCERTANYYRYLTEEIGDPPKR